jgi:hypothetical protein
MHIGEAHGLADGPNSVFDNHDRVAIEDIALRQHLTDARAERGIIWSGQKTVQLFWNFAHFLTHIAIGMLGICPCSLHFQFPEGHKQTQ